MMTINIGFFVCLMVEIKLIIQYVSIMLCRFSNDFALNKTRNLHIEKLTSNKIFSNFKLLMNIMQITLICAMLFLKKIIRVNDWTFKIWVK